MYDLNTLYGLSLPGDSVAHDINMNGTIAGQAKPSSTAMLQAFAWQLSTSGGGGGGGSISTIPLGGSLNVAGFGVQAGIAYAVNDASPAIVVGKAFEDHACGFKGVPFRVALDGSPSLDILSGTHYDSEAFNVNNDGPVESIVGMQSPPLASCLSNGSPCDGDFRNGALWVSGSGLPALLDPLTTSVQAEDRARGSNDPVFPYSSSIVGWGFKENPPPIGACLRQALFWASASASRTVLGNTMPAGQTGDPSLAMAIRNRYDAGRLQVVGWNTAQNRALLWEYDPNPNSWSVTDLTSVIPCPCDTASPPCSSNSWILREAHDINDNGWIIGWGDKVGAGVRAFLLVPIEECPSDLNNDGVVDGLDIGVLLAAWSSPTGSPGCAGAIPCRENLNMDCAGVVDGLDIGVLLAAWGNCPGGESLQGGSMMAQSSAGSDCAGMQAIIQVLINFGQSEYAAILQEMTGCGLE